MEIILYATRFVHYASVMVLFGGSLFRVIAATGAIDRALRPVTAAASLAALVSALSWLSLEAGDMAGDWSDCVDIATLETVLTQTLFGHLWEIRLGIGILLLPFAFRGDWRALTFCGGAYLLTLAWEGHGEIGGAAHHASQAVHLLAAGAWVGGLVPLTLLLAPGIVASGQAQRAVQRFSGLGYGAVSLVLMTGCVNAIILSAGGAAWLASPWGRVLLVKLGLVGLMLALAFVNRTLEVPAMARDWPRTRRSLRRKIAAELVVGALVLAAASVLGTLQPPHP
jgi:putative copper resistance protein D